MNLSTVNMVHFLTMEACNTFDTEDASDGNQSKTKTCGKEVEQTPKKATNSENEILNLKKSNIGLIAKFNEQILLEVKNGVKKFKCKLCAKMLNTKVGIAQHIHSVHAAKKRFQCEICYKQFSQRAELIIHKRSHELTNYHCEICRICFSHKSSLGRHNKNIHKNTSEMRTNTRDVDSQTVDDPEQGKCKKRRIHRDTSEIEKQLTLKKIINGDKVFQCIHCKKLLISKTSAIRHIRVVHNKEIIFACKLCDRKYASQSGLNSHVQSVHEPLGTYKCDICKKIFKTERLKTMHLKSFHKADDNVSKTAENIAESVVAENGTKVNDEEKDLE
ncbi:zinc finger protein 43-like protein, partial [Leptotrombidium deliense]